MMVYRRRLSCEIAVKTRFEVSRFEDFWETVISASF